MHGRRVWRRHEPVGPAGARRHASTQPVAAASADKNAYPVFLNADEGADPAVTAEQGGKGFTGNGWETNTNFDLIGDPRAAKGGVLREYVLDFPARSASTDPSRTPR